MVYDDTSIKLPHLGIPKVFPEPNWPRSQGGRPIVREAREHCGIPRHSATPLGVVPWRTSRQNIDDVRCFAHLTAPHLAAFILQSATGRPSAVPSSNRRALRSGKTGARGRADVKLVPALSNRGPLLGFWAPGRTVHVRSARPLLALRPEPLHPCIGACTQRARCPCLKLYWPGPGGKTMPRT